MRLRVWWLVHSLPSVQIRLVEPCVAGVRQKPCVQTRWVSMDPQRGPTQSSERHRHGVQGHRHGYPRGLGRDCSEVKVAELGWSSWHIQPPPKTERMCLPQWDGDPCGWRDYQQEVRLFKTGENLEVNWSVAARLVGGLKGAARRVGLAMTDQELLPTARNEKPTETVEV